MWNGEGPKVKKGELPKALKTLEECIVRIEKMEVCSPWTMENIACQHFEKGKAGHLFDGQDEEEEEEEDDAVKVRQKKRDTTEFPKKYVCGVGHVSSLALYSLACLFGLARDRHNRTDKEHLHFQAQTASHAPCCPKGEIKRKGDKPPRVTYSGELAEECGRELGSTDRVNKCFLGCAFKGETTVSRVENGHCCVHRERKEGGEVIAKR